MRRATGNSDLSDICRKLIKCTVHQISTTYFFERNSQHSDLMSNRSYFTFHHYWLTRPTWGMRLRIWWTYSPFISDKSRLDLYPLLPFMYRMNNYQFVHITSALFCALHYEESVVRDTIKRFAQYKMLWITIWMQYTISFRRGLT